MSKNKQKPQIIENVTVSDFAAEGKCIVKVDGQVIFIEGNVAPGDVVDVMITRKKSNYREGVVRKIHAYSDQRVAPFCEHFGLCGGCKWQHIALDTQLNQKWQQVYDHLHRIAKVELPTIFPILASESTQYYRNKLEFTFSPHRWLTTDEIANQTDLPRNVLGFHIPKRFDRILHIEHCYLQADPSNQIRLAVNGFAQKSGYTFYDSVNQHGQLRNLIIRTASTGQVMVIVQFGENNAEVVEATMQFVHAQFPELASLQYIINTKGNDSYQDQTVELYAGKPYIEEQMEGLTFRVGPKSFYQTNAQQAYNLYKIARQYAQLTGHETVYDLYTGTGTIANFVARQSKKVVGVEYVPDAVKDAVVNSTINEIYNTSFFAGDMKTLLNDDFVAQHGRPDVIITDPPRAGMDAPVVQTILRAAPQRVVYVSCNTATQARDLALMDELYAVRSVQPVDMFPHTHHVENVVLLEKR